MDTKRLVLTDDWQQLGGSGALYVDGIAEFCVCATEPAKDNPRHTLRQDLKFPDGQAVWFRRSGASPGQSFLNYTIFE